MKRVLLIAPKFYSYRTIIKDAMKNMGYMVKEYDERPSNSSLFKATTRLGINLWNSILIDKHYATITEEIKNNNYDVVLFINVECLKVKHLEEITKYKGKTQLKLYMWDSSLNKPGYKELISHFDEVFTFDNQDAIKYKISHLPLFYAEKKQAAANNGQGVCFIGSGHSNRLEIINKVKKYCESVNVSFEPYIYFPSIWLLIIKNIKLMVKSKGVNYVYRYCTTKPLDYKKVNDIMASSSIILDISHLKQAGLTMRTFEALGQNKKLITTNENIMEYDFYDPKMILLLSNIKDGDKIKKLELSICVYNEQCRNKYDISNWIEKIL